jgi:hypothetical protein
MGQFERVMCKLIKFMKNLIKNKGVINNCCLYSLWISNTAGFEFSGETS